MVKTKTMANNQFIINSSSFRDPSGFVFSYNKKILRQINLSYKENYEHLENSGLLKHLQDANLLISHKNFASLPGEFINSYKIIEPEKINFISYPYEWCFSQLKDAALLTLKIQKIALNHAMSLKDASAYNIQFHNGKPIMIDSLSFEKYENNKPWVAYKQFCQHFLAPLLLIKYKNYHASHLSKNFIDGIPLDIASTILPFYTYFNFSILTHIHLHAKTQSHFADKGVTKDKVKISKNSLLALIDNLESTTKNINLKNTKSEWSGYYSATNYSNESFQEKKEIIKDYVNKINPESIWDMGGNEGVFTRIASNNQIKSISFDIDVNAVEKNYQATKIKNEKNILPLVFDLTNPSPSIGWANRERISLKERGTADLIMALALIHHLTISNNIPFKLTAEYFSELGKYLIIEFVPKSDSNTKILLKTREDIFNNYTEEHFEKEYSVYFEILEKNNIKNSERTIYLMKKL